jgi:hypothetical protein
MGWLGRVRLLITLWLNKCTVVGIVATAVSACEMWIVCLKGQKYTSTKCKAFLTINYQRNGTGKYLI